MGLNMEILDIIFWNNSVKQYLIAFGILVLVLIFLKIFKIIVLKKLEKTAKKTKTKKDDYVIKAINSIGWPLYFVLGLYFCLKILTLPNFFVKGIKYLTFIVITYYVVVAIQKIIIIAIQKNVESKETKMDKHTGEILARITKIILWIIAIILIISNLGYDISTLIAGMGIGGIAIAFALQNILSDIFSSFSIYMDQPFRVGDFIVIGTDSGTVKKIGMKSTRIQTLHGEELVVSNKELTSARISNYKKMRKRRVVFNIGVTYGTSAKKLEIIPKIVKKVINKQKDAEFSRAHFKTFGDFSLIFEVVFIMKKKDYNVYMDTLQKINLGLFKEFKKSRIEMAFPTQTVYVKK